MEPARGRGGAQPRPLLLGDGAPQEVLAAFCAATAAGRPVAVLDAAWPAPLRAAAAAAVHAAAAAGRLGPGDLALFTSGSTGRPRGVLRTYASWLASSAPLAALTGLRGEDVVWVPGPTASTLSLHAAWHARLHGCEVAGPGAARPPAAASVLHAVPAALADAVEAAEAGLLPRLRCAVVAGDALAPALRGRALALGWRVVEYYGAAELSFVAARADGPGAPTREDPPAPGGMSPFGAASLTLEEDGELWVHSPYLATGYLATGHLEPAPAGPLRERTDGAGRRWASVGDRARPAGPGRLVVLGRGGLAVTTGGHTVPAADVEDVLRRVAGVRAALVVGTPHPRLGQVVTAVLCPPGEGLRARAEAACRALPAPARPRRWVELAQLPRTPAGKVDRQRTQEEACRALGLAPG
ncbi:hypothetical protein NUM3379_03670 [Kineococcus sp. NUM-3379]